MSWHQRFLVWTVIPVGLAALQIIWRWYWPAPFSHTQVIFAGLAIWLLYTPSKSDFFWAVFIIYWLLDLLSSAPLGINTISALASFIILFRLSTRVFTGHSVSTAFLLTAIGSGIFRAIYLLIAISVDFMDIEQIIGQNNLAMPIIWEIILTSIMAVVIFLAAVLGTRRFNPRYVLVDNIKKYD